MPRGRGIRPIALSNHDDINRSSQCRGVDLIVEAFHVREQFANDIHGEARFSPGTLHYYQTLSLHVQAAKMHH